MKRLVSRQCLSRSGTLIAAFTIMLAPGPAAAQIDVLVPEGDVVELIDSEERISGNAVTGVVLLVDDADVEVGPDRLWAYLPKTERPEVLRVSISSIDGRYFAEIRYRTSGVPDDTQWVALGLPLPQFAFLQQYRPSVDQIAALAVADGGDAFYPVWWGHDHDAVARGAERMPILAPDHKLRVYMNTERARAFVVVDDSPVACVDASAVSGFKFDALCDTTVATVQDDEPLVVHRRAGTRTLGSIELNVRLAL